MEAVDGVEPVVERDVRPLLRLAGWSAQRRAWRAGDGPRLRVATGPQGSERS